ncbi:uncharacterized protein LOC135057258 [Pseudophryne corroboree]|uniref:uncharacterized protein LOC135057258 n=1 Tax=Pseudophryne corroboree TaxID=495146 RepID=UPI00308135D1
MAQMMMLLRKQGVNIIPYLDNLLIMESPREKLLQSIVLTTRLLQSHGWILNFLKSHLEPTQRLSFLGMILDTEVQRMFLLRDKALESQKCRTPTMLTKKMMAPKYFAFFFTLVVFKTVNGEETNTRSSLSSEVAEPVQRRYSEAILASDYSRSVDNMLKKNFVDWLLARRQKKSDNISDLKKRQMDFQVPDYSMDKDTMDEPEGNNNFMPWLLKNKHVNRRSPERRSSFHNDVKVAVCQETLDLLMAMDLCTARFP